jgi:hypothetical protein
MIRTTLDIIVVFYLFSFLAGVFLMWFVFERLRLQHGKKADKLRLRCRMCAHEFEDPSDAELPVCPSCGSLNERETPPQTF